jgi:hypothetical protein
MGLCHSRWVLLLGVVGGLLGSAGCGTTRFTDTSRTATEQLLVSSAVDDVVSQMDFQVLAGKKVYFDPQYLESANDKGYIISSVRQQLLAQGCLLVEKKEDAGYVVEARCGAVGTDRHDLLFGIPQMNLPTVPPWQPISAIPEIPFAKKTEQKGVAKLAVFAYNRSSGKAVSQSGILQTDSNSKDFWVLGAGPFRSGTIRKNLQFAGDRLEIPFIPRAEEPEQAVATPGIPVAQPAIWHESPAAPLAQIKWTDIKGADGKK